ncbi:MAG: DedA family protein, partial [Deferribacterales bacterium]
MLHTFVDFVLGAVSDMGYTGIVFLMALESSFIPFPSEVVVPPAGYLAAQGEMIIYLVGLSGLLGSLRGA